jgi:hypothetical protein
MKITLTTNMRNDFKIIDVLHNLFAIIFTYDGCF